MFNLINSLFRFCPDRQKTKMCYLIDEKITEITVSTDVCVFGTKSMTLMKMLMHGYQLLLHEATQFVLKLTDFWKPWFPYFVKQLIEHVINCHNCQGKLRFLAARWKELSHFSASIQWLPLIVYEKVISPLWTFFPEPSFPSSLI